VGALTPQLASAQAVLCARHTQQLRQVLARARGRPVPVAAKAVGTGRKREAADRHHGKAPPYPPPLSRADEFHSITCAILFSGWLVACQGIVVYPPRKWLSEIRTSDSLTCFAPKTNKTRRGEARVSFIANDACVLHGCLFIREAALQCGLTCR
jgi:hypothetical protein